MCILYMEKRIARGGKGYELYCTVYSQTQTHPWEQVGKEQQEGEKTMRDTVLNTARHRRTHGNMWEQGEQQMVCVVLVLQVVQL